MKLLAKFSLVFVLVFGVERRGGRVFVVPVSCRRALAKRFCSRPG